MRAGRGISVLFALLAVALAGCGLSFGATTPDWHNPAWQHGFQAGREARRHYFAAGHHGQPGSQRQTLIAYCAERAFVEIQPVKAALLQWTNGFNTGCTTRLGSHGTRPRPSGTPAPR